MEIVDLIVVTFLLAALVAAIYGSLRFRRSLSGHDQLSFIIAALCGFIVLASLYLSLMCKIDCSYILGR
jgi:hypothetical protein